MPLYGFAHFQVADGGVTGVYRGPMDYFTYVPDAPQYNPSRLVEMVADGDLKLVEMTVDGPIFEYTNKGLDRLRDDQGFDPAETIAVAILATVLLLLVDWIVTFMLV